MIAVPIVRATAGGGPTHILPLVVIRRESLFSPGRRDPSFAAVCKVQGQKNGNRIYKIESRIYNTVVSDYTGSEFGDFWAYLALI